jgi:hypothetical protein
MRLEKRIIQKVSKINNSNWKNKNQSW